MENNRVTGVDWKGYRLAAWLGVFILAGIIIAGTQLGFSGRLVTGTCLAISSPFVIRHHRIPSLSALLFIVASIISAAGWLWDLYDRIPFYDNLAHVTATLSLTLIFGFSLLYSRIQAIRKTRFLLATGLISFGLMLGVFWEFLEFYFLTPRETMTLADTISDLVMDGVGAALSVPLCLAAQCD